MQISIGNYHTGAEHIKMLKRHWMQLAIFIKQASSSLSGKQMANVSLMPHNGGSQRRRQRRPAASKICNIHQSHSAHCWPGMRMSSRAALGVELQALAVPVPVPVPGPVLACGRGKSLVLDWFARRIFKSITHICGICGTQIWIPVRWVAVVGVSRLSVLLCFSLCHLCLSILFVCLFVVAWCVCERGMPQQSHMCPPTAALVKQRHKWVTLPVKRAINYAQYSCTIATTMAFWGPAKG